MAKPASVGPAVAVAGWPSLTSQVHPGVPAEAQAMNQQGLDFLASPKAPWTLGWWSLSSGPHRGRGAPPRPRKLGAEGSGCG